MRLRCTLSALSALFIRPLAWRRPRAAEEVAAPQVGVEGWDAHLLRDIDAPGRVHGQAREHSELARYDRQQARQR